MFVIELAIILDKSRKNYTEKFDLIALPYIPRKEEKLLWNGQLYKVLDVMYGFETNEEDYDCSVNSEIQTSIVSDLTCKVWIEEVD